MPDVIRSVNVPAGANLQEAIDLAQPGDKLVLQAGATYSGQFVLPAKSNPGKKWITITSSAEGKLPPYGARIRDADTANMPIIAGPGGNPVALSSAPGAGYYRLIGVRFTVPNGAPGSVSGLIRIGTGDETLDTTTHDIIFDRVSVEGKDESIRAVILQGNRVAMIGSRIFGWRCHCHDGGTGIGSIGNAVGILIENNFISAQGIGILFGGATPKNGVIPSDITIRANHFYQDPAYSTWPSKNLLEFKFGRRALIEGNVFENVWPTTSQGGPVFNLKSSNDHVVEHLTIRNNFGRGASGMTFKIAGRADPESPLLNNLLIENNVFTEIGSAGGYATTLMFSCTGAEKVSFIHNSFFAVPTAKRTMISGSVEPCSNDLTIRDNLFTESEIGIKADGTAEGTLSLNIHRGLIFTHNALIGRDASKYPAQNFFPADRSSAGIQSGQLPLSSGPLKGAGSDGADVGANVPLVMNAVARALSGSAPGTDTAPNAPTSLRTVN